MKTITGIAGAVLIAALAAPTAQAQSAAAPGAKDMRIQHIVQEDDAVRIEELRVRGQTQRIVVTPKNSRIGPYEIVPSGGGRDPSQPRGNAGQRQWSVLSF
jgi:hypothetical protein